MSNKETVVASMLGRIGRWLINIWASVTMLYLYLPIVVIVFYSFNNPTSAKTNSIWKGFTLKHWIKTFSGGTPDKFFVPELNYSLYRSIILALSTAVIATAMGTLIAFALSRFKLKHTSLIATILVLPLTTPEIVMGASLFTLFLDFSLTLGGMKIEIPFGYPTVMIAHVMFCMSYVALTIKARMRGFDWGLESAAQDLGATPRQAFFKVTIPLALPGIFAAALLSFALSFDDFIITLFTSSRELETFPLRVYGQSQRSLPPQINVLSTTLLLITTSLFIIPTVLSIRKEKQREEQRQREKLREKMDVISI